MWLYIQLSYLYKAGFTITDVNPDFVIVGETRSYNWDMMHKAAYFVANGARFIATNPDKVCPTSEKTVLVDCGSICKCIEYATGRRPDVTLGKPDPNMLQGIVRRHGLKPDEIAMAGDRLYTDIAMARNAGALGVLVLSGETTLETAIAASEPSEKGKAPEMFSPELIVRDIAELGELLLASRKLSVTPL